MKLFFDINFIKCLASVPLLLSLFSSAQSLPYIILIQIIIVMCFRTTYYGFMILIAGVLLYTLSNILNQSDVRYLLPFLFYFFIQNISSKNKIDKAEGFATYLVLFWWVSILFFLLAFIFIPSFSSSYVFSFYTFENSENFIYDYDDKSQFRFGAYYFNPNQLSYIVAIFLLFSKNLNINNKIIHSICIMAILLTQSRSLLLIYLLYNINFLGKKYFYLSLPLFIPVVYLLIMVFLEESRILSNLSQSIEHGLYKFNMLENLNEVDFINILMGSGFNNLLFFDSDFGSMIYYYGIFIALLILIIIYIELKKIIGKYNSILFYLLIFYGTIFTNTRMVVVTGGIVCFLLAMREARRRCVRR